VAHHFRAVVGGDTLAVRKPDAAPVRAALAALDERGGVLVGDGTHDVGAARAAGLDSIGVTWGIGSPVGATEVARDVTALCEALAGRGLCRYR
jgi:phosphoglycolate phosphatase